MTLSKPLQGFIAIKKALRLLPLFALGIVAASPASAITIKGKLASANGFKYVYIYKLFGNLGTKIDSAKLDKEGNFSFNTPKALPKQLYKLGVSDAQSSEIIIGQENLEITGSLLQLDQMEIKNAENTTWKAFRAGQKPFFTAIEGLNKRYTALQQKQQELGETNFNIEVKKISAVYDSANTAYNIWQQNFAETNTNTTAGTVASFLYFDPNQSDQQFLRVSEFNDQQLVGGEFVQTKIMTYLNRYAGGTPEGLEAAATTILAGLTPGTPVRELAYISLAQSAYESMPDLTRKLLKNASAEFPKSDRVKAFIKSLPKAEPAVGEMAPEIALNNPEGKEIKLSSLRGKVVLIDFWASWCRPCRMENPNVVKAYAAFKDKGFTVYSVSLDREKENWVAAIKSDNLTWPSHVSDLKFWACEGAKAYSVQGIPATFLVDKAGKIVGKNLRGPALEEKLQELLK